MLRIRLPFVISAENYDKVAYNFFLLHLKLQNSGQQLLSTGMFQ